MGKTCKTDKNPDLLSYILARETNKQVDKIISKSDKGCQKKRDIEIKRYRLVGKSLSEEVTIEVRIEGWEEGIIGRSERRTGRQREQPVQSS